MATVYGRHAAAKLASTLFIVAVGLSVVPWLMGSVSHYYLPFIALCDAGLVRDSLLLLRDPSREGAKRVKREVLAWMFMGLVAFLAGSLLH